MMDSQSNFIKENERLVFKVWNKHFAQKYYHFKEDLLQEGRIALHKANEMFDESKGFSFSSYAYRAIWNTMANYLIQKERIKNDKPIYLEDLIPDTKDRNITFGDSIEDSKAKEALEKIIDKTAYGPFIAKITNCLPFETQMLIFKKYGIGFRPHTLRELAQKEGVTPEAIRFRIQKAFKIMRTRYAEEWEEFNQ
jgi:RNA polymerase sigma factor (sigma-70 family)